MCPHRGHRATFRGLAHRTVTLENITQVFVAESRNVAFLYEILEVWRFAESLTSGLGTSVLLQFKYTTASTLHQSGHPTDLRHVDNHANNTESVEGRSKSECWITLERGLNG